MVCMASVVLLANFPPIDTILTQLLSDPNYQLPQEYSHPVLEEKIKSIKSVLNGFQAHLITNKHMYDPELYEQILNWHKTRYPGFNIDLIVPAIQKINNVLSPYISPAAGGKSRRYKRIRSKRQKNLK